MTAPLAFFSTIQQAAEASYFPRSGRLGHAGVSFFELTGAGECDIQKCI
jgi:hypothetical protein